MFYCNSNRYETIKDVWFLVTSSWFSNTFEKLLAFESKEKILDTAIILRNIIGTLKSTISTDWCLNHHRQLQVFNYKFISEKVRVTKHKNWTYFFEHSKDRLLFGNRAFIVLWLGTFLQVIYHIFTILLSSGWIVKMLKFFNVHWQFYRISIIFCIPSKKAWNHEVLFTVGQQWLKK